MMKCAPDLSLAELKEIGRSAARKARANASSAGLAISGTLPSKGGQRFTRRLDVRPADAGAAVPDDIRARTTARKTPISV